MQVYRRVMIVGLLAGAGSLGMAGGLIGCEAPNPYHRQQGVNAYDRGDLRAAETRFSRVLERDATDWRAAYHLGKVRLDQDRPLDAQLLLERALTLRPDHPETPDILDALAESLYRQNRHDNLHAMLAGVASRSHDSRDFLRQADYLTRTGDLDGAKLAYRKAAHFAKDGDPAPYLAAADFYESIGDGGQAVAALRQAYTIEPHNTRIANRLRSYGLVPGPTLYLEKAER